MNSKKYLRGLKQLLLGSTAVMIASLSLSASAVLRDDLPSAAYKFSDSKRSDRIIVRYSESFSGVSTQTYTTDVAKKMSKRSKRKMRKLRRMYNGDYVMKFDKKLSSAEMDTVIDELLKEPGVVSATVDRMMYPMFEPNDQYYYLQWHYFETTGGLNLPNAWDITNGSGVVVAVLDTGYRPHVDLVDNIIGGYDMISDATVGSDGDGRDADATDPGDICEEAGGESSSWHGTHVAGTIAAETDNGIGVAGVAYGSKIVPVRVLGTCGGYTSDIADGIVWAAGGNVSGVPSNPYPAQVLNLSLGGPGSCDDYTQNAIDTARALGSTVVVAAGNSGINASGFSPASCDGVITVAATNRDGGRSYYSNYGSAVDLAAPGGELSVANDPNGILSTIDAGTITPVGDSYEFSQGTSMAAPHVAGVAALLYAVDPAITPDEVEAILKGTARDFPSSCSQCGDGIVDATAALEYVVGGTTTTVGELSNGVAVTGISAATNANVYYTLSVPAGVSDLSFTISGGSGDADLYVRYGSEPTSTSYDCRPFIDGSEESCSFSSPSAGTYYVMVNAYQSFAGLSLIANYSQGNGNTGTVSSIDESSLSGSSGTWQHFSLDVASGASSLVAAITGGTGDADLYVRYGTEPTSSTYQCRPWLDGNEESCSISSPDAGTWYISIYGYSAYTDVDLSAQAQ